MQIVGLAAGGHAKVVIEILQFVGGHEIVGLLDPRQELWGTDVLGVPVLGDDGRLPDLYNQGVRGAFIGLGSIGGTQPRKRLYEKARRQGFQIVRTIHPQSVISPSVQIGYGTTIMAGALINAAARLGDNVIVNTGAIVEHDCIIGDHVHIATGAQLAGAVQIDEGAHIGLGACIKQGVHIGQNSVVGAGTVVVHDVPPNVVVVGTPARILREVNG